MVQAQYCSEWSELWDSTLVRFLCSELTDDWRHNLYKTYIDFPRWILLSEWMEWPKTFNELKGKKNPTKTVSDIKIWITKWIPWIQLNMLQPWPIMMTQLQKKQQKLHQFVNVHRLGTNVNINIGLSDMPVINKGRVKLGHDNVTSTRVHVVQLSCFHTT